VSFAIDSTASAVRDEVVEKLKTEADFDKVAATIAPKGNVRVESSVTPLVPSNNQDGGQAEAASDLNIGEISKPFRSTTGDGYYIVKLLQKDNNDRISYATLKIPLTEFQKQLDEAKKSDKLKEYISVPQVKEPDSL
jgi:hypothetical protein